MSASNNTPLPHSSGPHLTRSSWVKIILILIVSFFIFANMWSCMSDATTHHSTRNTSVERVATPIPLTSDEDGSTTTIDPNTFANYMNTPFDQASASWVLPADSLKDMDITWACGSITIHPLPKSAGNNIVALYTSSNDDNLENAPIVELIDGVLSVYPASNPMSSIPFLFSDLSKTSLEIGIPETVAQNLDSVNLDTASGAVTLSELTANETQLGIASGDLRVETLNTKNLEVNMMSGTASLNSNVSDDLSISVASGKLNLASNLCPSVLNADLVSGRIDLALPQDSALTINLDKVTGSFENLLSTASQNTSSFSAADINITSGSMTIKPLDEA